MHGPPEFMRKRLTVCCTAAVIAALTLNCWGDERISVRLNSNRLDNRLTAPRLSMRAVADKPEVAVQKVAPRKAGSVDENVRKNLRTAQERRKIKRVVAAQN